ncbi:dnaJ domain-containing protein [Hirsutella rhossiliensis]|uniref:DnaJ domain-containing protein n=1 Tax=Hirsutella rhossiliensis TaxID=111463 RepID=A0A9P8N0E8_9HYPO|nr:dnaJ domain-containing protein [Hirsutella rhossiliensis]KAH0963659.1 dnaJ domain-containing protein [Hirsutella rhossiliensis]
MTLLRPDPYKVLGVSKDAQIPEIRSAHRKLILKCHPDKVQDPALKAQKQDEFQKVQQAYELLSDDRERQKYDDQIKLAELRKQFQAQANISTPRSAPKEYNIYTAEPPGPMGRSPPPVSKVYAHSRSWEDDFGRGPQIFDAGTPRSSRREASYPERPSKREMERERERDRDAKDRDRDRDRRRKAEDARRAEKEAKEQRRSDKNKREKQRDKDIRREADEKRRYAKPYNESFDDEPPLSKSDKKKSSSGKKHEEKRDRSSGPQRSYSSAMDYAQSYIEASRAKKGAPPGLQRSKTYHPRQVQPPAPTPPPMTGPSSPFSAPDDDPVEEPLVMNASPTNRHTAQFSKSTSATPQPPSSPPWREVPRTSSLPVDSAFPARPVPGIMRAQTFSAFNAFAEGAARGRARSRRHAQIEEESETEQAYDRQTREREGKHRSSRRHRSPEPENVSRYQVDGGRAKLQGTYSRRLEAELDPHRYYSTSAGIPVVESRPPMAGRESSYAGPGMKFPRIKTSKAYGYDDVKYSNYHEKPYREGYTAYA